MTPFLNVRRVIGPTTRSTNLAALNLIMLLINNLWSPKLFSSDLLM